MAPLVGKQPPDIHIWIVKSEAPTFLEFEGPLSQDSPVWRIELTAPEPDAEKKGKIEEVNFNPDYVTAIARFVDLAAIQRSIVNAAREEAV